MTCPQTLSTAQAPARTRSADLSPPGPCQTGQVGCCAHKNAKLTQTEFIVQEMLSSVELLHGRLLHSMPTPKKKKSVLEHLYRCKMYQSI